MRRRALLICCDETASGDLVGARFDCQNYKEFLTSKLGGDWTNKEVLTLFNPVESEVINARDQFLTGVDYTFTVFSGHGFINVANGRQYIELADSDIQISNLRTNAPRQTIIVDACRGYFNPSNIILKGFEESYEQFIGDVYSTRTIFDNAILSAEKGLTILFAANENESALDTNLGGAYSLSLLSIAEKWEEVDRKMNILDLKIAHNYASKYLYNNFETIQTPTMNTEKRMRYFPFAVKATPLHS